VKDQRIARNFQKSIAALNVIKEDASDRNLESAATCFVPAGALALNKAIAW